MAVVLRYLLENGERLYSDPPVMDDEARMIFKDWKEGGRSYQLEDGRTLTLVLDQVQ